MRHLAYVSAKTLIAWGIGSGITDHVNVFVLFWFVCPINDLTMIFALVSVSNVQNPKYIIIRHALVNVGNRFVLRVFDLIHSNVVVSVIRNAKEVIISIRLNVSVNVDRKIVQ